MVQYYPQVQASTEGLEIYLPQIRGVPKGYVVPRVAKCIETERNE